MIIKTPKPDYRRYPSTWELSFRVELRAFGGLKKVVKVGCERLGIAARDIYESVFEEMKEEEEDVKRIEVAAIDNDILDRWVEESKWFLSGQEGLDMTLSVYYLSGDWVKFY